MSQLDAALTYLCCCCCIWACCCYDDEDMENESISTSAMGTFKQVNFNQDSSMQLNVFVIDTVTTAEPRKVNNSGVAQEEHIEPEAMPNTNETDPNWRQSFESAGTMEDIPRIDVRLGLFEDERFKDVSEAIFKKHS